MAALYGSLRGNRGVTTRLGSKASGIHSTLQTWDGSIHTFLNADGSYSVEVKSDLRRGGGDWKTVASGNVNGPDSETDAGLVRRVPVETA